MMTCASCLRGLPPPGQNLLQAQADALLGEDLEPPVRRRPPTVLQGIPRWARLPSAGVPPLIDYTPTPPAEHPWCDSPPARADRRRAPAGVRAWLGGQRARAARLLPAADHRPRPPAPSGAAVAPVGSEHFLNNPDYVNPYGLPGPARGGRRPQRFLVSSRGGPAAAPPLGSNALGEESGHPAQPNADVEEPASDRLAIVPAAESGETPGGARPAAASSPLVPAPPPGGGRETHQGVLPTPLADRILAMVGSDMNTDTRRRLETWLARRGVSIEDLEERDTRRDVGEVLQFGEALDSESAAAAAALGATGSL